MIHYLSIDLSIYLSTYLSIDLSIYLSIYLSIHLSIYLSLSLYIYNIYWFIICRCFGRCWNMLKLTARFSSADSVRGCQSSCKNVIRNHVAIVAFLFRFILSQGNWIFSNLKEICGIVCEIDNYVWCENGWLVSWHTRVDLQISWGHVHELAPMLRCLALTDLPQMSKWKYFVVLYERAMNSGVSAS